MAMLACVTAHAAPVTPDAGQLLQQMQNERGAPLPQKMEPEKTPTPQAMAPIAGLSVTVSEFRFVGNSLLTQQKLELAVAEYLNHPLSFAELQNATIAVAQVYRDAGWIVRAFLPKQDIKDGIVSIQIVEAVFGALKMEGAASRVAAALIQRGVEAQQAVGAPLNSNAIDRALLLADDLPGVQVTGSLLEGAHPRETDLILNLVDEPWLIADAGLDNTGARSTGSARLSANLNLTSPLRLADQFSANGIHTQGSDYLQLKWTLPVGNDGWRIGAYGSNLVYKLVTAEFVALDGHGSSDNLGAEASYPLIRSRLKKL